MDKVHGFLTKLCWVRKTFQVNITLLTLPFCSLTSLIEKDDDNNCKMLLDTIIENYKNACYLFLFSFLCLASPKIASISAAACNPKPPGIPVKLILLQIPPITGLSIEEHLNVELTPLGAKSSPKGQFRKCHWRKVLLDFFLSQALPAGLVIFFASKWHLVTGQI